ncbi:hypothetical protein FALB51S_04258 [Frigidibacter albus]
MIYSDKQYAITEGQLGKLRHALAAAQSEDTDATGEQSWLRDAQADAIRSQIATLEAELSHYKLLKSGEITFAKTHSLENLPSVLVQARIAAGMSQTELAERLGMKAQQIQRYEASDYSGASLDRLIGVCEVLNVHTTGLFKSDDTSKGFVFSWSNIDDVVWNQLPAREMAKRGWFDVPRKGDVYQLAREYFMRAAGPQFASAYHRKKMHGGSMPNEYALLAWQARNPRACARHCGDLRPTRVRRRRSLDCRSRRTYAAKRRCQARAGASSVQRHHLSCGEAPVGHLPRWWGHARSRRSAGHRAHAAI